MDARGELCPRAAAIAGEIAARQAEARRLRDLRERQTGEALARVTPAAGGGGAAHDPVQERACASAAIARATSEHLLQFVDLALEKLQTQDAWWRGELERAGAQSGGLTDYVTQLASETSEVIERSSSRDALDRDGLDDGDEQWEDATDEHATEMVRGICCRRRRHHRHRLPMPRPDVEVTLWNLLKDLIGQDLTRVTLPVFINEPLTFQQRLAEELEAWPLLDIAAGGTEPLLPDDADWHEAESLRRPADLAQHSVLRLLHAVTFAIAGYASTFGRTRKPFNPLLGETYELVESGSDGGGIRHFSEQVGHHPPVTAFHCESLRQTEEGKPTFVLSGGVEPKTKFKGTRVDAVPHGELSVTTEPHGDRFLWRKVNTSLNNVIVGTQYLDHWGVLRMSNAATGDSAAVEFHKPGMFSGSSAPINQVSGTVRDRQGNDVFKLEGSWSEELWATPCQPYAEETLGLKVMGRRLVWRRTPLPPWSASMYGMSAFGFGLNDDHDLESSSAASHLPATDARRRPDVRALERGDLDAAAKEKVRLEEQQRAARKARGKAGATEENDWGWAPRWFARAAPEGVTAGHSAPPEAWSFTRQYWQAKVKGDFGDVPQIY